MGIPSTKRHVPAAEYAMLRNLESLTGNLFRLEFTTLKQLTKSWLWTGIQEQLKGLARERAQAKWEDKS